MKLPNLKKLVTVWVFSLVLFHSLTTTINPLPKHWTYCVHSFPSQRLFHLHEPFYLLCSHFCLQYISLLSCIIWSIQGSTSKCQQLCAHILSMYFNFRYIYCMCDRLRKIALPAKLILLIDALQLHFFSHKVAIDGRLCYLWASHHMRLLIGLFI